MRAELKMFAAGVLMAFMLGCASVAILPKTPDQQLYAAYGLYVTLTQTTADLVETGTISPEQGQRVKERLDAVRPRLDALRAVFGSGLDMPESQLEALRAVNLILLDIQRELQMEAGDGR